MATERPWWAGFVWDGMVLAAGVALVLLAKDDSARHLGTLLLGGFTIGGYALRYPNGPTPSDTPPSPPDNPNTKPEGADMVKVPSGKYHIAEPSVALALAAFCVAMFKQLLGIGGRHV